MKKGKLITFEGLDKVGKSTQVEKLVEWLRSENRPVTLVREPGSTEVSERIREILLDKDHTGKITPLTELLLYNSARSQLVDENIRPALERGEIVVADRFYDSTTAYQGYGRGLDIEMIRGINMAATGSLIPDLTILLTIGPLEEAINNHRRFKSSSGDDRLERESLDFRERVRQGYLSIAHAEPERFLVVNAEDSIENISAKIRERVERLIITD